MKRINKNLLIVLVSVVAIGVIFLVAFVKNETPMITNTQLASLVQQGKVSKAVILDDMLILKTEEGNKKILKEIADLRLLDKTTIIHKEESINLFEWFIQVLIVVLMVVLIIAFVRARNSNKGVQAEMAKAGNEIESPHFSVTTNSKVHFSDVAGISEVKAELVEIVDFLKNPKKYRDFGINLPKGVLLVGPPGVGKTLIAKALAGEAGTPFFYQSGASFVQMYVGIGAKRVRELFAAAKKSAPSIIFIDEIDAVGKARGATRNDEREATLNQLLTEMDGFEGSEGVIVIAATNKIEMLDEALLRSGRFDRRVYVELPALQERAEILSVHLKGKPHTVECLTIAQMSVGFSGSALANFVNESALNAMKRGAIAIELKDFEAVKEKVAFGTKKAIVFNEREKEVMALYQAAKALFAYWYGVEFERITLLGGGLKEVDKAISSKTEILGKMKIHLAGLEACELFFEERYTAAYEDIDKVRTLATEMVEIYGMGKTLLGDGGQITALIEEARRDVRSLCERSKAVLAMLATRLKSEEAIEYADVKEAVNAVF